MTTANPGAFALQEAVNRLVVRIPPKDHPCDCGIAAAVAPWPFHAVGCSFRRWARKSLGLSVTESVLPTGTSGRDPRLRPSTQAAIAANNDEGSVAMSDTSVGLRRWELQEAAVLAVLEAMGWTDDRGTPATEGVPAQALWDLATDVAMAVLEAQIRAELAAYPVRYVSMEPADIDRAAAEAAALVAQVWGAP